MKADVVRVAEGVVDPTVCVPWGVVVVPLWETMLFDCGPEPEAIPARVTKKVALLATSRSAISRLTIAQKRRGRFCGFGKFSSATPEARGG